MKYCCAKLRRFDRILSAACFWQKGLGHAHNRNKTIKQPSFSHGVGDIYLAVCIGKFTRWAQSYGWIFFGQFCHYLTPACCMPRYNDGQQIWKFGAKPVVYVCSQFFLTVKTAGEKPYLTTAYAGGQLFKSCGIIRKWPGQVFQVPEDAYIAASKAFVSFGIDLCLGEA